MNQQQPPRGIAPDPSHALPTGAPKQTMKGVRRNAALNVAGNIVPMLAAVFAMPMLLNGLGAPRMGIFTLALGLFGFAGIFDLGLGRALTRSIAHYTQLGTALSRIAPLLRAGLLVVLLLGIAWGLLLWNASGWLLAQMPMLSGPLRHETATGLAILAAMIPVALLSTSLLAALEGLQQFWRSNVIRAPLGVATFLVPALVAQWFPTLGAVIGALALVRLGGLAALMIVVAQQIPLLAPRQPDPLPTASMWRYTGWLTISNIVGPLMVYGDRYYLATLLPPAAVSYYTVPMDTMFRATSLPGAALGAAFPALTGAQHEPQQAARFLADANTLLLFAWLVPLAAVGVLLPDALRLWLGEVYGQQMFETSRLILAGILINGFALVPFTILQAIGRTDITAKLHLMELPLFVVSLMILVPAFGVVGAALAWGLRVAIDGLCLAFLARRLFPALSRQFLHLALSAALGAFVVMGSGLLDSTSARIMGAALLLLISVVELSRRGGFSWLLSFARPYR